MMNIHRALRSSTLGILVLAIGASACAGVDDVPDTPPSHEPIATSSQALALDAHVYWEKTVHEIDALATAEKVAGYRPISVSVYGESVWSMNYAASFVKRGGPDWRLAKGIGHAAFQTAFNEMAEQSYKPTMFSFDGSATDPMWVAVFEKTQGSIPLTRQGLVSGDSSNSTTIQHWLVKAREQDLIPVAFSSYGPSDAPRYSIVLEPNPSRKSWAIGTHSTSNDKWNGFGLSETFSSHVARYNAQASGSNRPSILSRHAGGTRYSTLYRGDSVGDWTMLNGLTSSQLATEVATQKVLGRVPISLEGTFTSMALRYDVVFAESDVPLTRSFQAKGSGAAIDQAIPAIDDLMKVYMGRNDVRHAALAVLDKERLVYARGYTHAEPGYPVVDSTTRFRLASVGKLVTAMEIMYLVDRGMLELDEKVQDILGLTTWEGKAPPAEFATILVRDLLVHDFPSLTMGGVKRCLRGEVDASDSAARVLEKSLPLGKLDAVRYTLAQADLIAPTENARCYSNLGYVLLGMVVEKRTARTFSDALARHLFTPLSITSFATASSAPPWGAPFNEALYRSAYLKVTESINVEGTPLAPTPYGGWNFTIGEASGGVHRDARRHGAPLGDAEHGHVEPDLQERERPEFRRVDGHAARHEQLRLRGHVGHRFLQGRAPRWSSIERGVPTGRDLVRPLLRAERPLELAASRGRLVSDLGRARYRARGRQPRCPSRPLSGVRDAVALKIARSRGRAVATCSPRGARRSGPRDVLRPCGCARRLVCACSTRAWGQPSRVLALDHRAVRSERSAEPAPRSSEIAARSRRCASAVAASPTPRSTSCATRPAAE